MDTFLDKLQELIGIQPENLEKIITSLIIFLILWVLRFLTIRILWRRSDNVRVRYQWRRNATYTLVFILLFALGFVWIERFQTIGTFLGLLSAGIAIALKDLLANLAGWLFIMVRKPFKIGDRIEIENIAGDVIDIHVFRFTLLEMGNWVEADQTTGRVVHIPNGKIFVNALANYHAGFNYIWNEIPVLITFESNWMKAKDILTNIINEHAEKLSETMEKEIKEASKKFMIHYKYLTPIVYTKVKEFGVLLTIRYLCQIRNRRGSEQALWEDILKQFSAYNDIDFAYPTTRFFDNAAEGSTRNSLEKR